MKDQLNKAYWNYVNDLTASLKTNPKKFWSFVKARIGNRSVASCIEYEGQRAYTPLDKANLFNSFFQSVYIKVSKASNFQNSNQLTEHVIGDLSCSVEEVTNYFNKSMSIKHLALTIFLQEYSRNVLWNCPYP